MSAAKAEMPSHGFVAPTWESVQVEFDKLLEDPSEGGQVCVYFEGKKVVDLVGGNMDRGNIHPVSHSTLSVIYSASKGVGALMLSMLIDQGLVDVDEPVSKYWPEFAANGKAGMTVRVAASHRGGLFSCAELSLYDSVDFVRCMEFVATQPSEALSVGYTSAYHGLTIGIIMGGIVYKVTGLTPDAFIHKNIAAPLGLDLYCSRPRARDIAARITEQRTKAAAPPPPEVLAVLAPIMAPGTPYDRAMRFHKHAALGAGNPRCFEDNCDNVNFGTVENPSYACFTNARSLARMYAAMLWEVDGVRLLSDKTVALVSRPDMMGADQVVSFSMTHVGWGPTGFMGPTMSIPLGFLGPVDEGFTAGDISTYGYFKDTFGSPGLGGAYGFANPVLQAAGAFVPTLYQSAGTTSPRILAAIGAAIKAHRECE